LSAGIADELVRVGAQTNGALAEVFIGALVKYLQELEPDALILLQIPSTLVRETNY
jgi:hypothetical protein|tara:strand:- start:735 stop:902 length:168 start_codon:yes stop_codon:yes gene_type:complete